MNPKIGKRNIPNNNIYKILYDKNMTQSELAKVIGIDNGELNKIINRKKNIFISTAFKICKGLDKPINEVFFQD